MSITDACLGWDTTVEMLARLADAVRRAASRSRTDLDRGERVSDASAPVEVELKLASHPPRSASLRASPRASVRSRADARARASIVSTYSRHAPTSA